MLPYDEAGTGPALVLLHAGIADRSMWAEHVAPLAAAGYRVIAPDLPGFGESPEGPGPLAPWTDVLTLLDGLGIGEAALAGDSFGAAVALRVAVVAPERVHALALVSARAEEIAVSERLRAVWAAEEEAVERGDIDGAVQAVVDGWTLPDAPPELRDHVAAMQRRALELQLAAGEPEEAPDPLDEDPDWPARLRMPVLLVAGERDMPDCQEAVHVYHGRLPHARAEFIPGAGHLAPLETPDAFRALLLDFLGSPVGMADVLITEYTDPGCPWAYSAEPFRRRLDWLYGDRLRWETCMVVLAEDPQEYLERDFTPERQSAAFATIARDHGMPIDTRLRPRMAATAPACRAVVAARLHAPERERRLLRRLRIRHFAGELLDAPETVAGAARDAGLDPEALVRWMAGDDVSEALERDKARAREPMPAARALDHKLANWSGGRRYTCPSYEIVRLSDGVRLAVPGFQPFAAYDVLLGNLVPGADRREPPEDVAEVLRWTGTPLATKEVAVVCDIDVARAREALGRVAVEQHLGFDGLWSLPQAA